MKTSPEKLAYIKAYRERNREKILAKLRAHWAEHKDELNAKSKEYRKQPHVKEKQRIRDKARRQTPQEKERKRLWHQVNKQKSYTWHKVRHAVRVREDPIYRIRVLINSAKSRSKALGREFEEGLLAALTAGGLPKTCRCCGCELDYVTVSRGRSRQPSIDRFDSSLGYTIANTKIVCTRCNSLKNAATVEDLRHILAYMERGG
jgi:hypothetical protein